MRTFAQKPKATQKSTSSKSTKPSRAFLGQSRDVQSILHLHRTIGNQAVQQLLQCKTEDFEVSSTSSTSAGSAHDFSRIPLHASRNSSIQPKLNVNPPGDEYELEADRVADKVLKQEIPEEEDEEDRTVDIQTKVSHQAPKEELGANEDLEARLNYTRGSGKSLSDEVRTFFEPRLNYDFNKVRVHTNNEAAQMNRELGARAFTHGRDIYFGVSQYNPHSTAGKRLLAHELVHVIQQRSQVVARKNEGSLVDVSQSEIEQAVQEAKTALGEGDKESEDKVAEAWKRFRDSTKSQIRKIQEFLKDYQQTEVYLQVKGKDAGDLLMDEIKGAIKGKIEGAASKANPVFGMIVKTVIGIWEDSTSVEKAKEVLDKQRKSLAENEDIRIDKMALALDNVFTEVEKFFAVSELKGFVRSRIDWFEGILRRESKDTIQLRKDEAENLQEFKDATQHFLVHLTEIQNTSVRVVFGLKKVESDIKAALLEARTKRIAGNKGRFEVYVATYRNANGDLEETRIFGWTVQGLELGRDEANEALILLLGDGFLWKMVPLETWVANIEFIRLPGRTPSRTMVQVIKYNAENREIGRSNAPTSGEFAFPREVFRFLAFHGLTRDLAGKEPIHPLM